MQRGFASTALFTFVTGLLLSQTMTPPAQAQRVTERMATTAITAPPLISAPDAGTPIGLRSASMQVETDGGLARTTLFQILMGEMEPDEGSFKWGVTTSQSYFPKDNSKYFDFVDKCRAIGITVPIIPGLKPITFMNQLTVLPKIFHTDIPVEFARELQACKTDEQAAEIGVEWCIAQAKDLIAKDVKSIHFYSMMATQSVKKVAQADY